MFAQLGYERGEVPVTLQQHLAAAFAFAMEVGMRQGEIVGLTWNRVFAKQRYLKRDGVPPIFRVAFDTERPGEVSAER